MALSVQGICAGSDFLRKAAFENQNRHLRKAAIRCWANSKDLLLDWQLDFRIEKKYCLKHSY
ncbi:MAG: hypothetical protein WED33_00370, partial [Bacteroidia bacterium]